MKTNQQSSRRRVLTINTLITLGLIILFGCSQNALGQQQQNLTRTLPTTVNNEVDIGSFEFSSGGGSLWISVTVPSAGYSVAKEYLLPIQYNQNINIWQTVLATSSTGPYSGNDFALDVKINGGAASLRLRTTASDGANVGTAYIFIRQEGAPTDTFTASTATSAASAPTTFFSSTALTQVGGKVGIGTASPGVSLEVDASASATGAIRTKTALNQNVFQYLKPDGTNLLRATWDGGNFHHYLDGSLYYNLNGNSAVFSAGSLRSSTLRVDLTNPANWQSEGFRAGELTYAAATTPLTTQQLAMSTFAWNGSNGYSLSSTAGLRLEQLSATNQDARLSLVVGNTQRLSVLPNGNVGIGTTSPTIGKLQVAAGATTAVRLDANSGVAALNIGGTGEIIVDAPGVGGGRFVVKDSGNVGIGTSGPGYRLDVQGGQVNSSGGLCIAGDCKTAWSQVGGSQWTTAGSNIHYNSGNVGMGVTAPVLKLDIGGLGSAVGFFPGNASGLGTNAVLNRIVARSNYGAVDATSAAEIKFLTGNANWYKGQIAFYTNDYDSTQGGNTLERMRITSPGNVGIGTTSPGARLHVNAGGTSAILLGADSDFPTYNVVSLNGSVTDAGHLGLAGGGGTDKTLYVDTPTGGTINFRVNVSSKVLIDTSGNVGIGTATPTSKLHVAGDGRFTGNLTVDGNIAAKYQDMAEWVESSQALAAGTVVVLDHTRSNQVIASLQAYDTRVAGVISLQPGITLGEKGEGKVLVATTGRVKIKVDASRGSIQVGDLLVTSDVAGLAMKSQPIDVGGVQIHRPGTLIGKALEPLAKGAGEILVLLSLQ